MAGVRKLTPTLTLNTPPGFHSLTEATPRGSVDDWKVIGELGKGCYATVRLANHTKTKKPAAMKVIPKRIEDKEQDLQRLQLECQVMVSLEHPNIVKLYEVKETSTEIVLIMEFCEGGDLLDYIRKKRKLPETEARKFFSQMVSAIHYTHSNLFVHRDIKAENIFLDSKGNVKIGDWGFAAKWRLGSTMNLSCGSLHYSCPEICEGREYVGPEVDVWSLGVLLFGMVAGSLPFYGENEWAIYQKIRVGEYRTPRYFSKGLSDLISSMLQVDRLKRASIYDIRRHPWVLGTHETAISPSPALSSSQPATPAAVAAAAAPPSTPLATAPAPPEPEAPVSTQTSKTATPSSPTPARAVQVEAEVVEGRTSPAASPSPLRNEKSSKEVEEDESKMGKGFSRGVLAHGKRKFSVGRLFSRLTGRKERAEKTEKFMDPIERLTNKKRVPSGETPIEEEAGRRRAASNAPLPSDYPSPQPARSARPSPLRKQTTMANLQSSPAPPTVAAPPSLKEGEMLDIYKDGKTGSNTSKASIVIETPTVETRGRRSMSMSGMLPSLPKLGGGSKAPKSRLAQVKEMDD